MPRSSAPRAPRKKATHATTRAFLFSDLRDYTSYVEAKGDAAAARLLRDYRTLVRREVARHDGAEVKTEGDSFYLVFETPSSAVDCAVAILRAADIRNAKDPTTPLRVGVGVHAGQTVAYDDQFVGSAVNIASRLAGKASAGELLISDTLRGLVRTSMSLPMDERGPLDLKGVSEPVRAWAVTWRDEPAPRPMSAPPPLASATRRGPTGQFLCPVVIGRMTEIATLEDRLASGAGGQGSVVMLSGEAGVGKSAFVREATERATARRFRVLNGLTHQSDSGLPYAPFVSAIRSGFRGLDRDELGRVLQRSVPDLAELFPELGRSPRGDRSGLERHRLSVAFQHLLYAFSRETPLLIVLEDLHWADEASLDLLGHLARELRDARIVLLGTYRSDEMHRRHPMLRTLAELQRERLVTELSLKRLTPDETRELIRATFAPTHPTIKVSAEFRDAIYARSEGNPFFTEELLKALVESGGVYYTEGQGWDRKPIGELEIPGSIRETFRARVERLSVEARQTLSAAAVIGLRFSFDLLQTVRATEEIVIEAHLREFIEEQLVAEASEQDDEYAFRHALTREVVYDDLLVRERKRLHRTVADALATAERSEPSLVAHHLLAAGEQERAVPLLLEAARRAYLTDAPREAVAHITRALDIGVPDGDVARTLELQAEAYHYFDVVLSLKAAREAAETYRERDDARGRSRALRLASRCHWMRGEGEEAQSLAREARDVLSDEPESLELGRATAHLAGLRMVDNDSDESIALADRAIAIGQRTDDAWTVSNALITKGSAIGRSDAERGLTLIKEGTALAERHNLTDTVGRGLNNGVLWSNLAGRPADEIDAEIEKALVWMRAHGVERSSAAWLHNQRAWAQAGNGDLAGARATLAEVEASGIRVGFALALLIDVLIEGPDRNLARTNEAVEIGRRAIDAQQYIPSQAIAATVRILADRREEARKDLGNALDAIRASGRGSELLQGPWIALFIVAGHALDMPEWHTIVSENPNAPSPRLREARRQLFDSSDSILRGDYEGAAVAFERSSSEMMTIMRGNRPLFLLAVITLLHEMRRRQIPLTRGWKRVAASFRGFAERSGAVWALSEIAKAEA